MYVESAISKGVPLAYLTIDLVQRLYFLLSRAWRWTSSMNYMYFSILGLGGTALYFRVNLNLNLYTGNARDSVRKKEFLVHSFNIGGDQIDKLIKFFDNGFNEKKKKHHWRSVLLWQTCRSETPLTMVNEVKGYYAHSRSFVSLWLGGRLGGLEIPIVLPAPGIVSLDVQLIEKTWRGKGRSEASDVAVRNEIIWYVWTNANLGIQTKEKREVPVKVQFIVDIDGNPGSRPEVFGVGLLVDGRGRVPGKFQRLRLYY